MIHDLASNLASGLPHWLRPGDDRPRQEIDDEIAEELRLHVDLLTEENERQGMPPDEARRTAEARFGDLDLLTRRCRKIKQGDIPMLNRIQAGVTVVLLLAVIFLIVRDYNVGVSTIQFMDQTTAFLQTIQGDLEGLRKEMPPERTTSENSSHLFNITAQAGSLDEEEYQPLKDASYYLTVKTWGPSGYNKKQIDFQTDADGKHGPAAILGQPANTYRLHWVVCKKGYAFRIYSPMNQKTIGQEDTEFLYADLPKSMAVTLVLRTESGESLRNAAVVADGRIYNAKSPGFGGGGGIGTHTAYDFLREGDFLRIKELIAETDADGRVTLDWFAEKDKAHIRVSTGNGKWHQLKFDVVSSDQPLELVVSDQNLAPRQELSIPVGGGAGQF